MNQILLHFCIYLAAPSVGLYFELNNNIYLPNDVVIISEIGDILIYPSTHEFPGSALVCVTTNVNMDCCRPRDKNNNTHGGLVGQWFFPNSTIVPRPMNSSSFSRRGGANQVGLTRLEGKPAGPPGVYRCDVPHGNNGTNISASISLVERKLLIVFYGSVSSLNFLSNTLLFSFLAKTKVYIPQVL